MEHARASSEVTRRPGTNMVSIGPWGDSRDSVTAPLPSPQGEGHRGERASTEGPRFPSLSSPGAGAADPVTETATPGLSEYLSEYLWWHPFCQLPPGVTSPGPEESANEKPQQTRTAPAWGPTSCAPGQGGTRLSTHYGLGVLLELGLIVRPVCLLQQVRQESLEHKRPFRAPSSDSPPLAHSAVHAICIGFISHNSLTP